MQLCCLALIYLLSLAINKCRSRKVSRTGNNISILDFYSPINEKPYFPQKDIRDFLLSKS